MLFRSQSEVPNGSYDLCSLNSVVAVYSGGVTFALKDRKSVVRERV